MAKILVHEGFTIKSVKTYTCVDMGNWIVFKENQVEFLNEDIVKLDTTGFENQINEQDTVIIIYGGDNAYDVVWNDKQQKKAYLILCQ